MVNVTAPPPPRSRRRKKGEAATVDPELLASLVAERAQLVDWAEAPRLRSAGQRRNAGARVEAQG